MTTTGAPQLVRAGRHGGEWTASRTFEAVASSVRRVRDWVRLRLSSEEVPEDVQDIAELLISEVTTNAIVHAEGESITVELRGGGTLEAAVRDDDGVHLPMARTARDEDMSGRGLALVQTLAQSWGTRAARPGKWVWFRLGLGPDPADLPDRTGS